MKKILIIEDDPYVLRFYERLFSVNSGYSIETLSDSTQALEKTIDFAPDLILLDIVMPNKDGLSVLKELKASPITKSIQVIILTNLSETETMKEAASNGASGFLIKSNTKAEDLLKYIDLFLNKSNG